MPSTQLLLYGFGPDATFEGQLVGALERIETGGTVRVLDGLFIRRDPETAELSAIRVGADAARADTSALLGFRLDPAERRRATERTLAGGGDAIPPETARELAMALAPGTALAAILVEHVWADALEDAVARTGGTRLQSSFVDATRLADLAGELLAAAVRTAH
jgi:hypothetical protein